MTYNNAIPQPTDFISVSQGQILTNFAQLQTVFNQDHVEYDNGTVANRGKHNLVTFREQAADPVTIGSEIALYAKDDGSAPQLFYAQESAGTVSQLTYPFTKAQTGTCVLPGGMRLQWGRDTIPGSGTTKAVTFTTPFGAAPYIVISHPLQSTDRVIFSDSVAAAGYTLSASAAVSGAGIICSYYAIGPV